MKKQEIEFFLRKEKSYSLKPFGRFNIKWKVGEKNKNNPKYLALYELSFIYDAGYPCEGEIDKEIIKFMKANKTDVLVDESFRFYTRIGIGFTEITCDKLREYRRYLTSHLYEDSPEVWEMYLSGKGYK